MHFKEENVTGFSHVTVRVNGTDGVATKVFFFSFVFAGDECIRLSELCFVKGTDRVTSFVVVMLFKV